MIKAAKTFFITFMLLCISHLEVNSGQFAHVNLRFLFLLNFYFTIWKFYTTGFFFLIICVHNFILGMDKVQNLQLDS